MEPVCFVCMIHIIVYVAVQRRKKNKICEGDDKRSFSTIPRIINVPIFSMNFFHFLLQKNIVFFVIKFVSIYS